MLAALRAQVRDDLAAADITALEYVGEAISPPCAVVIPGEPYVRRPDGTRRIPFGKVHVGVDVLLLVPRTESAKTTAAAIDELIEQAYGALKKNHDIGTVARPGVVTVSGSKFVGSVLSIEALSEEP